MADCKHCKRPTGGATLCAKCRRTGEVAWGNVAAYWVDFTTIRSKQTRYGPAGHSVIGKTMPLGMDLRFAPGGVGSKTENVVRKVTANWVSELAKVTAKPTRHDVPSRCGYLMRHMNVAVGQPWAADMLKDVLDLEYRLRRVVDRPADSWYAGVCGLIVEAERPHDQTTCVCAHHTGAATCDIDGGCGTSPVLEEVRCTRTLYAEPGKAFVRCRDCGTTWNVDERRNQLLEEAEDCQVTVRLLARIVTTLGAHDASEAKLEARINTWVYRRRLVSHGKRVVDGRPRPVYRVGDVLDLLAADVRAKGA